MRHTYASHYVMNGGGIAEMQMLLGHSTPQMTQKYAHLTPGFLEWWEIGGEPVEKTEALLNS